MPDQADRLICLELNTVGYVEALERGLNYPAAPELAAAFIGELLTELHFSRLARGRRARGRGADQSTRCKIVSSLSGALALRGELQKACVRGFDTLFVVRTGSSFPLDFFLRNGYAVAQRLALDSTASALFGQLPSNGTELEPCVRALQRDPEESVVLFGHDADPVWLIQSE